MSTELSAQRGTITEDTGLSTKVSQSSEISVSQASAMARHEVEGAIIIAKRFPRNEDDVLSKVLRSCKRPGFAEDVCYSFPRGKNKDGTPNLITGPSVYLARTMARLWGNMRYGMDVISDDSATRVIRGWAWDIETNARVSMDDSFAKLIQRKVWNKGPDGRATPTTQWVVPDERDLRELTNKRGALLVRNCILALMPSDFIEDAIVQADVTLASRDAQDPDAARKRIIAAFDSINVSVADLEAHLGHPLKSASPSEIGSLRKAYKSIVDGNSTWSEYASASNKPPAGNGGTSPGDTSASAGTVTGADLTKQKPTEQSKEEKPEQKPAEDQSAPEGDSSSSQPADVAHDREAFFADIQRRYDEVTSMGKFLSLNKEIAGQCNGDAELLRHEGIASAAKERIRKK